MLQSAPPRPPEPRPPLRAVARGPRPNRDEPWDALLIAVAVFIATAVGRLHQLFPLVAVFKPVMLAGLVAVILVVLTPDRRRSLVASWSRSLTWLACFVFWAMLSIPSSLWPGGSFTLLFDDFIKTALIVVILVMAVRSRRDVERLAFTYFLSAAIYAFVAYLRTGGGGGGRVEDFYTYDANDFAAYAVSAIPLGLHFLRTKHKPLIRMAAGFGTAFLFLTFMSAQSRGGFLALVACCFALLFWYRSVRRGIRVATMSVCTAVFLGLAGPSYLERIESIWVGEKDYNRTSDTGRLEVWKRGLGYMAARPITGVGAGMFGTAEGKLSDLAARQRYGIGVKWSTAHNTYIQTGAELGVPGVLFYLLFMFGTMRAVARVAKEPSLDPGSDAAMAQAFLASMIAFTVGAFFLSLAYWPFGYILAAIALGLLKTRGSKPVQGQARPRRTPAYSAVQ